MRDSVTGSVTHGYALEIAVGAGPNVIVPLGANEAAIVCEAETSANVQLVTAPIDAPSTSTSSTE
jgi:hypothetical protein